MRHAISSARTTLASLSLLTAFSVSPLAPNARAAETEASRTDDVTITTHEHRPIETVQLPGTVATPAADTASSTATRPRSITEVEVYRNPYQLSISPGVVSYRSPGEQSESRLSVSALFARNFAPTDTAPSPIQYGFESGLLYSHLGAPGASFFGTGGGYGQGADGNLFAIPLHLWGAYYFPESRVLLGLHTGADLLLRTDDSTMDLGNTGAAHFYPAFGFKAGVDTRNNYAVTFEANWTLAPNAAVFSGIIGATIPLS